jgi:uncharacterized protein YceK
MMVMAAVWLSGCGIVSKLDAMSSMSESAASYRACVAEHKKIEGEACENQRLIYQRDLSEAQRTRGILTNWPPI